MFALKAEPPPECDDASNGLEKVAGHMPPN